MEWLLALDFIALYFNFALILLIPVIAFYVLLNIGLMGIAEQTDTGNGWMAWVPFLSLYLFGKIALNSATGWLLLVLSLLSRNKLASLAFLIVFLVSLYKIYQKMSTKAVVMMIFSILSFGLLVPVFLFAIRKNVPYM